MPCIISCVARGLCLCCFAYGSWCKTVAESGIISSRTVWADVPDAFRTIVRRLEIFRRFAASTAEIYFIMYTVSLFILYSQDGIMSSIFSWEHTKIRTDRLFKKRYYHKPMRLTPFLRSAGKCFDCHTGRGRNGACISDPKGKNKKSDSSFLRVVAFRRIRLKKLQIVAGRAFFSHLTVSMSVSFSERGV